MSRPLTCSPTYQISANDQSGVRPIQYIPTLGIIRSTAGVPNFTAVKILCTSEVELYYTKLRISRAPMYQSVSKQKKLPTS